MTPDASLPVTVLSSFLGAGKTTFSNRVLNNLDGLRVAVIVPTAASINLRGTGETRLVLVLDPVFDPEDEA